jgi:hypothetical protein
MQSGSLVSRCRRDQPEEGEFMWRGAASNTLSIGKRREQTHVHRGWSEEGHDELRVLEVAQEGRRVRYFRD